MRAACRSLNTASRTSRGRGLDRAPRTSSTNGWATSGSPRAARRPWRDRRRQGTRATSSWRSRPAATSTCTRRGRTTARTRSKRWRPPPRPRLRVRRDHRPRSLLGEGRFEAQAKEIAKLQKKLAPFKLLGVEVSIRVDGTVDFADEDLAKCDWVVASLHSAFDKSPTERILAAMENPHVDCIGHPTARKLNKRRRRPRHREGRGEGLETGTYIEINSQPDRSTFATTRAGRRRGRRS